MINETEGAIRDVLQFIEDDDNAIHLAELSSNARLMSPSGHQPRVSAAKGVDVALRERDRVTTNVKRMDRPSGSKGTTGFGLGRWSRCKRLRTKRFKAAVIRSAV